MLSGKWMKEPSHTCASVWRASLSLENSLKCSLGLFGCSECSWWHAPFLTKGTRGGYFLSITKHYTFYVSYLVTHPIYVIDFQGHSLPLWVAVKTTKASKCDLKRLSMIFYFFMTTISCKYKVKRGCLLLLHFVTLPMYFSLLEAILLLSAWSPLLCHLEFTHSHWAPAKSVLFSIP